MKLVTGCTGIEGIGIAAQWAGMEIVGQIEIDEFCIKILEKYWPDVKRIKNMFNVRGDEFGTVDIFAAGIPCQPFSNAGKRRGNEDDRYLWPETFRIIRTMQPTWVIIENVDGIGTMEQSDYEIDLEGETTICTEADMVLETIRKDFEGAGYQTLMLEIPACAVGARHRRDRYFIVAHSGGRGFCESDICGEQQGRTEVISASEVVGYTRLQRQKERKEQTTGLEQSGEYVADANNKGLEGRNGEIIRECSGELPTGEGDTYVADTKGSECKGNRRETRRWWTKSGCGGWWTTQSEMGGSTDELSGRIHGFRQPAYMGQPQYQWEPSRTATGVKNRTNRLKALGNAVDPLQIYPLLQIIYWIENGVD